jgi:hypothetical protein
MVENIITLSEDNPDMSLKDLMLSCNYEELTPMVQTALYDEVESESTDDRVNKIKAQLSAPAILRFDQVTVALYSSLNYTSLKSSLSVIRNDINTNLSGTDKDYVSVYLETIEKSAHIWFPTSM